MQIFKEHHHKLLTALFLTGVLLVIGSFSSESPPAIAASTPGEQIAKLDEQWNYTITIEQSICPDGGNFCTKPATLNKFLSIIYTGQVTKGGALIVSSDVLSRQDIIRLDLIELASYETTGFSSDTPPAPWTANPLDPQFYYDLCNLNTEHIIDWSIPNSCQLVAIKPPGVSINASGMSCNGFSVSDISEGIRQLSATCTITTTGPTASLNLAIASTEFGDVNWGLPLLISLGLVNPHILRPANLAWTFDVASVPQPQPPTLQFWGDPTTITQGDASTLQWTLGGGPADNCAATGGWSGGKLTSGGTQSVTPPSTTDYFLECTNSAGSSGVKNVMITVNPPPVPTADINANPTSITFNTPSNITWSSTDANSCVVTPCPSGQTAACDDLNNSGISTGNLTSNQTYTLNCSGPGGTAPQDSVTVNVNANRAPNVNAGSSHNNLIVNISHPHGGASATDPDGSATPLASYKWEFVSCPGTCPSVVSGTISDSDGQANVPDRTYTPTVIGDYRLRLTVTDSFGLSGSAEITDSVIQQAPNANAKIKACASGGAACLQSPTDGINVIQGKLYEITLSASDSSDPDGWTSAYGISNGGKCEWNSNLDQLNSSPWPGRIDKTITSPANPTACNTNLGTLTFNDPPGQYIYQVLRIVDNNGTVSNIDTVTVNVQAECSGGETKPHSICQNNSCVAVNACGTSSCSSNSDCAPPPTCPIVGQNKPHNACQNNACVQVDACGVTSCGTSADCGGVSLPECSDLDSNGNPLDNADPEDVLANAADPGCHDDSDPNNPNSYRSNDNDEADGIGNVMIKRVGPANDTPSAPSNTLAWVDSSSKIVSNPAMFFDISSGIHTAHVTNVPEKHLEVGTCSYFIIGGTECVVQSYSPNVSCTTGDCSTTIFVSGGKVTKVVYKYMPFVPECSDGVDNNDTEDIIADQLDPGCHTDGNPNNPDSYDPADNDERESTFREI